MAAAFKRFQRDRLTLEGYRETESYQPSAEEEAIAQALDEVLNPEFYNQDGEEADTEFDPSGFEGGDESDGTEYGEDLEYEDIEAAVMAEGEVREAARLSKWRGGGRDGKTIEMWIDSVNRLQTMTGWGDEKVASRACDAMEDEGAAFIRRLQLEPGGEAKLRSWALLSPELLKRFSESLTAAQKQKSINSLTQKQGEAVRKFYDRVVYTVLDIHRSEREKLQGADQDATTAMKEGFDRAVKVSMQVLFLAGLKSDLREEIESELKDDSGMDWIMNKAVQIETARGRKGASVGIHEVNLSTQQKPQTTPQQNPKPTNAAPGAAESWLALQQEIAALTTKMGSWTKEKKEKKDLPPLPPMDQRDKWIYCNNCGTWGKHVARECKVSREEGRKRERQQRSQKPSGPVFDSQYPN